MSNVSIFEKKWLDLVFEGKNQKYGAYQLRRESSKTTLLALFFGTTFLLGGTFLLSSFNTKPIVEKEDPFKGDVIRVNTYKPPVDKHENTKIEKPKTETQKAPVDNKNYRVAPTEQAVVPVSKTTENPIPNVPTSPSGGAAISGGGTTTGGGSITISSPIDTGTHGTSELDRQPQFPGGIKNFYQYVGNNFDKQQVEEGETVKVMVSFVIERNGSMTDIDVIEKTNPSVDKEAIRVLKSLKIKWAPGYKDGEPVRTRYTLPITVQAE